MKGWQIAALVVGLVLVGIVAFKKVAPGKPAAKTVTTPGASNDLFTSLVSLGAAIGSKVTAPSSKAETSPQAAPYYGYGGGAYSTTTGIVGNELEDHAVYGPEYRP